jgi:PLP dependent protein
MTLNPEAVAVLSTRVGQNLSDLRERMRAAQSPKVSSESIEIVAVTKGHGPEAVAACLANGLTLIGENYAEELVVKASMPELREATWTYQGRLQTNKINRLLPHVALWQTVDTAERAGALAKRSPGARVLVQLDLTGVAGRGGVAPESAAGLVDAARSLGLRVEGVMGVGPDPSESGWIPACSSSAFQLAVSVADDLGVRVRSLGMSHDFELAVRAGSTMVRLGTALVGSR